MFKKDTHYSFVMSRPKHTRTKFNSVSSMSILYTKGMVTGVVTFLQHLDYFSVIKAYRRNWAQRLLSPCLYSRHTLFFRAVPENAKMGPLLVLSYHLIAEDAMFEETSQLKRYRPIVQSHFNETS